MVSNVASQKEGPGGLHVLLMSVLVSSRTPGSKDEDVRLICDSKVSVGVNVSVCSCLCLYVCPVIDWQPVHPYKDKQLGKWMNGQ